MSATLIGFAAFMVAFTVPVLYFTWMSLRDETHSPAAFEESTAGADD